MKRVLPVIFACLGLVGLAVLQSDNGLKPAGEVQLSAAKPVAVEVLTQ
ncbi:hypothetical protein NBRC116601_18860 [Cognatishimia sp. WU-CL00825]